jgi:beta-phosphoglucomutase
MATFPESKSVIIEGIIFDMDGVLIDSHPAHREAWRKFLGTLGKVVSDEELGFILEGRRRDEILRYFLGELSESKIIEYGHQKDSFFRESFGEVKLMPGVSQFLETLARLGLKAAIATSATARRTQGTLEHLSLQKHFAVIVTGDDVSAGKPDPGVYKLAAQQMNVSPERLLALEDAPCGILAARAAGMRCVGVSTNGRADVLLRSGAEFVIPDFGSASVEKLLQFSMGSN